MDTIAAITSTGEETSLTLLTGAGRVVYTVLSPRTAWVSAVAAASWSAPAAQSAWAAGEVIL
jgi:hypothetical protein